MVIALKHLLTARKIKEFNDQFELPFGRCHLIDCYLLKCLVLLRCAVLLRGWYLIGTFKWKRRQLVLVFRNYSLTSTNNQKVIWDTHTDK